MSGSNGTVALPEAGLIGAPSPAAEGPASSGGLSQLEHWASQVDSPFRPVAEVQALTEAAVGAAQPNDALGEALAEPSDNRPGRFGEDFTPAEEEYEAFGEAEAGEAEADSLDLAEFAEADLLEETPGSEHPLAAVFSLPRLAFDAMAKGGWATAIAVAIGSGLRDVNKLTNMIFWFRHPNLIGQKIRSDQSDLIREWLDIRDQIVKPAISARPEPAANAPTSVPSAPPSSATASQTSIPSSQLDWPGKSDEQKRFMRAVYDAHVAWSKTQGDGRFVANLPDSQLDWIDKEKHHQLRKDAAVWAKSLIAAAEAKLIEDGLVGQVRFGIRSAYRPATTQFVIWQGKGRSGGFPAYYKETERARLAKGDPHGPDAVQVLMKHMRKKVAAPGYSNHQDGTAIDFATRKGPGDLFKVYEGSWFHNWLKANARKFNFHPLAGEAWHWYFVPPKGSASEAWEAESSWPQTEVETTSSEAEARPSWEVAPTTIKAGGFAVPRIPLLASHRGSAPDLILRWNDMPSVPTEVDVAVHLHGYSWATMTLPKHMEVWAGLDLAPVDGASGTGRTRPTLTVLPRGHFTGIRSSGKIYRYTFPALTTKDGLTTLIQVALKEFSDRVGGLTPKVGRLILTAHSGGGSPLMQILRRLDPDKVHEVHVFDGLYQDADTLAGWASRHIKADRTAVQAGGAPAGAMRVFFRPGTRTYSLRLLKAITSDLDGAPSTITDRYRVEASTLGHWQIPRQYGWRILADAGADVPDARRPVVAGFTPAPPATRRLSEAEEGLEVAFEEPELEDGLETETEGFEETESEEREGEGAATFEVGEFEDLEAGFELESEGEGEGEGLDGLEAELEDPAADLEDPEMESQDIAVEADLEDLEDRAAAGAPGLAASQGWDGESLDAVRSAVGLLDLAPDQEHPALTAVRQLMSFQFGPDLRQGSTGVAVTALQNGLTRLGHAVPANGTFGVDTLNAVRAFQRSAGLCDRGVVGVQSKVAIVRALTRLMNPQFDPLPEAIVRIARNQHSRWQVNGTFIRETDKAASPILIEYYRDGLCPQPPVEKQVQDDRWHCKNPWSAAFVSWVMRSAGAGDDFRYSAAHLTYVRAARLNRCNNVTTNPFWAYRATEVAPELGDLVCKSGHEGAADATTYENVMQGPARPLHCDIVTAGPQNGRIMVTGGNVALPIPGASEIHGQTVAERPLRVDANGMLVLTGKQSSIFAVIRCRGRAPGVPQPC